MPGRATLLFALCACSALKPPAADCADAGCAGCCDAMGRCQAGVEAAACGERGAACATCAVTEDCVAHACAPIAQPSCGASTCSGCCDDGGVCRAGRFAQECGAGGAACFGCGPAQLCSFGACFAVVQCDVSCGAQCCGGGACTGTPCGTDGGSCATCAAGEVCTAGACAAASPSGYRLRVVSARIAPLQPDGRPWDELNDPDAKLCASVGDAGVSCTLEVSDTFSPVWTTTFPTAFDLAQLQHVELSVIDNDYPGQTVVDELGVFDLRPRWSGSTQQWVIDGVSVTRLRLDVLPP